MYKIFNVTDKDMNLVRRLPLRAADVQELQTASGMSDPYEAIRQSLSMSVWAELWAEIDGVPFALAGLSKYEAIGVPWMVASEKLRNHKKILMHYSRKKLRQWAVEYPLLANVVDSRNGLHIAWLKRMGFRFEQSGNIIKNGVEFLYFYMIGDNHV